MGGLMSNHKDPVMDHVIGNVSKGNVRQMTVYDRMEDAKRRRKALFAEQNSAPKPVLTLKASNETTPPTRAETVAEQPIPQFTRVEKTRPRRHRRQNSNYWSSLFQAMAAVFVVAVLIAVFARNEGPGESPAAAAALVQPTIVTDALPAKTDAVLPLREQSEIIALANAPQAPDVLVEQLSDVGFTPIAQSVFWVPTNLSRPSSRDDVPTKQDSFSAFVSRFAPASFTSVPPPRPLSDATADTAAVN